MTEPRRPWPEARPLHGDERPALLFRVLVGIGGVVLVGTALLLLTWAVMGPIAWR